MPRPVPPLGSPCPYRDACPCLDGLSTTWVYGEYLRSEETYQEHLRIIDVLDERLEKADKRIRELERETAELRAKLKVLHARQFKPNRKSGEEGGKHNEQSASSTTGKEAKKRGAPVGHPGWFRPEPARIDRTVRVPAPMRCPHCRSDNLRPTSALDEHVQEDIVVKPSTVVTRYLHASAYCPKCRRLVVQAAKDEILHAPIGPVAKSTAVYLRYRVGIPYRKTKEVLSDLFGLACAPASLVGFDRRATRNGTAIYEDLREKIRASDVVHADETSWRSDGVSHFAWYAGNENLAFFHIDRHRSAAVAEAIFGKGFGGTLVRDRYAAYNGIGANWQSCLAHIIRKAKEIRQEHALLPDAEKDKNADVFCAKVVERMQEACKTAEKLRAGALPWSVAADIERRSIADLKKICKHPLNFKPAETLRAYLAGPDQKSLFTFLRVPGVPPTNNQAEQSLRHMVIFRKVCFGTRSPKGLKTHSILPSLVQTARRQGVHPREFLETLLTADTATAQAELYYDSS